LQTRVQVHEGAVEIGIALAQHDDVDLAREPREPLGPGIVEIGEQLRVFRAVERDFRSDRIFHRIFAGISREQSLHDAARLAQLPLLAEVSDVLRGPHNTVGAHAHQVGIARAEATADDASHRYSLRLASALTAATVIAEPPRRPSTVSAGTGDAAINAALDSAAPTKPTGQPMIAAGRGQSASSSMLSR